MIWDKQEGETTNQYCWFNEFLLHDDLSLKNFHEKISTSNQPIINSKSQKKKKIPTYKTIKTWSCNNEWTKRKEAYLKYRKEQQRYRLEELDDKNKETIHQLENEIILGLLKQLKKEVITQEITGYQSNQKVSAVTSLRDDIRKDIGSPTEITENKSEVTVTENNPFEGLKDYSLKEWLQDDNQQH